MLLVLMALSAVSEGEYALLAPGEFHNNEVFVEENIDWFALMHDGEEWQLVPYSLSIEQVHDPVLDDDDEATGWRVGEEQSKALAFISSAGGIFEEGEVHTELVDVGPLTPGDFFPLVGDEAILVEGSGVYYNLHGDSQKLCDAHDTEHGEGAYILLLGDLDGDGLNDVLVNDLSHYAIYMNYRLFLSSEAEEGALLKEVASFTAVSC